MLFQPVRGRTHLVFLRRLRFKTTRIRIGGLVNEGGIVNVDVSQLITTEILYTRPLERSVLRCHVISNNGDLTPTGRLLSAKAIMPEFFFWWIQKLQFITIS